MNDDLEQAAQTAAEHAAAAAVAEGGRSARTRPSRPAALAPDTPEGICANCHTPLQGPVCHNCGQLADEYHRPARGLVFEIIEGLTALDGRVARTIPDLLLRPGRVTRAYLKGARARFMPPFRLYIIASLIFFLLAPGFDNLVEAIENGAGALETVEREAAMRTFETELEEAVASGELSEAEAAQARRTLSFIGIAGTQGEGAAAETAPEAEAGETDGARAPPKSGAASEDAAEPDAQDGLTPAFSMTRGDGTSRGIDLGGDNDPEAIRRYFSPEDFGEPAPDTVWPLPLRRHLGERFSEVAADPGGWLEAVTDWVPRIMFAMVPVYALLLSMVYAWRRRFYFYDHLVVSLHFHSALFLTLALLMLASNLIGAGWAWVALAVYSNFYLYRLNRRVYGRGRISSALRTLTLDALYFVVLLFGFVVVLLLGALV
ncbi:MAG: DUF3667 domain-containing protein [Oceanicaulis sp.]